MSRCPNFRTLWLAALLGAFLGSLFAAWPASAAQFITVEDECRGRQLLIQGAIEPGDFRRLRRQLADLVHGDLPSVQDPDKLWTVLLDSPGGDLDEAMRMGRLLRQALATTEVSYRFARRPDGVYDFARSSESVCLGGEGRLAGCEPDIIEAECTGACLLLWLGGADRIANEGRLGLHGLSGSGSAAAVTGYLQDMGQPPERATALVTEAPGDGWLDWPQRHALGGRAEPLQALLAGCPAPLDSEESYLSIIAPSAAERDRLMDRAEAHRVCRRARLAASRAALVAELQPADRAGAAAGGG